MALLQLRSTEEESDLLFQEVQLATHCDKLRRETDWETAVRLLRWRQFHNLDDVEKIAPEDDLIAAWRIVFGNDIKKFEEFVQLTDVMFKLIYPEQVKILKKLLLDHAACVNSKRGPPW